MTYPAILILAQCVEERIIDSLVETVEEQTLDDTLYDEVRWNNERHNLLWKESKDAAPSVCTLLMRVTLPRTEATPQGNGLCLCCRPVKTQT